MILMFILYEYLYWFVSDFITLFILSVIVIKFVLRENLKDYGLQVGELKVRNNILRCFSNCDDNP